MALVAEFPARIENDRSYPIVISDFSLPPTGFWRWQILRDSYREGDDLFALAGFGDLGFLRFGERGVRSAEAWKQ